MGKKRVRQGSATTASRRSNSSLDMPAHENAAVSPWRFSFFSVLLFIVVLGLCLRLVNVLQTTTVPTTIELIGDARGYFDWGKRIAGGDWYGTETFYQAPLYPYFLAVLFSVHANSVTVVRLIQCLLGAMGIGLLGVAARNKFGERTGIVAALMLALYPPAIYYDGLIQKAALASVLLCLLIAALSYLPRYFRLATGLSIGLSLGLLVLTRENALLWIPLIPLWMLAGFRSYSIRQRAIVLGGYLVGLTLVLMPVAARNRSLGGEWSPTTFQSGPNFYIGNNLHANGVYQGLVPGHETPEFEREDAERLAEQAVGHPLTPRQVSRYWMGRAGEEIAQDPLRWVQLSILKMAMVLNRYEVPDVESFYVQRMWSWPLSVLQHIWHFGVLGPLAVLGIWLTHDRWRELWLDYLLIVSMIFAVALFFILGRYRLPLVPLLVPFAAAAIVNGRAWFVARGSSRWIALGVLGLAIVVCNAPLHDEQGLNASSYMNVGISAGQAGDMPTCLRWLEAAVQANPQNAVGHYNLAGAQAMSGRPVQAIESLQRARLLDPQLVQVDFQLAMLYEQIGRRQEALAYYQNALRDEQASSDARAAIERLSQPSE